MIPARLDLDRPSSANPGGLWLFAVDATEAQLTWRDLGPGKVTIEAREVSGDPTMVSVTTSTTDGGPGAVLVEGLRPGRSHRLVVTGDGLPPDGVITEVRTLDEPPGEELFRFATVSDLHLGERNFGYLGTMRESPTPAVFHPERALAAALDEIRAWGAELVVAKGDVTNDGRVAEWESFGAALSRTGLPWEATIGNHDNRPVDRRRSRTQAALWVLRGGPLRSLLVRESHRGPAIEPIRGLEHIGYRRDHPVFSVEVPGLRLVLADTTVQSRHVGSFAPIADAVLDEAAAARRAGLPVLVAAHHFPMPFAVPHFWPPGIPSGEAAAFFRGLRQVNRRAFYTAGHTHRNRAYERSGIPCTEVGSPKDFPGTWAGYAVHDGGIRQVVWRVARPDVLQWTDRSRRAALGLWGWWSPGRRAARCLSHPWPT